MRLVDVIRQLFGQRPGSSPAPPPPARPVKPAPPPVAPPPAGIDPAAVVFDLQNKTRTSYNLPALTWDVLAAAAAQKHISECARRGVLSHTGANGSSVGDRLRDAGLYWTAAGENIASGQPTPEAAVRAWFNSPGHRANMLNAGYTVCGVGVASDAAGRVWWCVAFARPRSKSASTLLVTQLDPPDCPGPLTEVSREPATRTHPC